MYNSGGYRLVVRRGPQPNQVYELTQESATIGRDVNNEITINDPEVSRHHCRLTRTPNGYMFEDLGSTNGTFVNGQRLTEKRLLNVGDLIGLGETVTLAYETSVGAQPAGYGNRGQQQQSAPPQAAPSAPSASPSPYGGGGGGYQQPPQQQQQQQQGYGGGYGNYEPPAPSAPGPGSPYDPSPGAYYQPPPSSYSQAYGTGYDQADARGNRGCGVMIGCGIFVVLGVVILVIVGIVANTPVDDTPLLSDIVNFVPLPGSSVDNSQKFLESLNECDIETAQKYVCDDYSSVVPEESACTPSTVSSVSCEKTGNDVLCSYTIEEGGTERKIEDLRFNIRNGQICGIVLLDN